MSEEATLIWCDVVLANVPKYELWKDDAWYHAVDWHSVCRATHDLLYTLGRERALADLSRRASEMSAAWSDEDAEGLTSLLMWPIQASKVQITDGGHRINAMRLQGVRSTPGVCYGGDIGESIAISTVYPGQLG